MNNQIRINLLFCTIGIVFFLGSSQLFAKRYRATPLFFLSEREYASIKDLLNLSSSQEERISSIVKNKFETQQTLIKKGNRLIRIIGAYEAIQNKQDYWDKKGIQIASGLSQNQINQMRKDWEKIEHLKSQAHMIDDLKIKSVLDDGQITQWYSYKFYHQAESILPKHGISADKDILTQKVTKAVDYMLQDYSVIDQRIVDEVFLNMCSESQ